MRREIWWLVIMCNSVARFRHSDLQEVHLKLFVAPVLPLNYTCVVAAVREFTTVGGRESPPDGRGMVSVTVDGSRDC